MAIKHVLVALVAAAIAIFAMQNSAPTAVRFLLWTLEGVPLATIILGSAAGGLLVAGVPLAISRARLRSRLRREEARLAQLESQPGERDRAPGSSATGA